MIYVKDYLLNKSRHDLQAHDVKCIWIEIQLDMLSRHTARKVSELGEQFSLPDYYITNTLIKKTQPPSYT